jgi:lipoate-protein ligase B
MEFKVFDLGLIDFGIAEQFQGKICLEVKNGILDSGLVFCRHYPAITLGKSAKKSNILVSRQELKLRGIQVYDTGRGGDVTYHGPGQLMVYPIFNLSYLKKDIHWFLRQLEEVVISFLSDFGIKAERRMGLTGVWVNEKKIASIGIAIKNWITFHGLSLNVKKQDLDNFGSIRPCGMDIEMTSLETILERDIDICHIKQALILKFEGRF